MNDISFSPISVDFTIDDAEKSITVIKTKSPQEKHQYADP
jgi:hypothetical protein